MQMKMSITGRVDKDSEWNDGSPVPVVRLVQADGTQHPDRLIDVEELLADFAKIVPDGTTLRITIETVR
jgi:hypothetical protein